MTSLDVGIVLRKALKGLGDFPEQASSATTTRYSVPRLVSALLTHAPNSRSVGEGSWAAIYEGSPSDVWRRLVAGYEIQTDRSMFHQITINDAGIRAMTDVIRTSPEVQKKMHFWAKTYFEAFVQPLRDARSTAAALRYRIPRGGHHDPTLIRALLARDGPACLVTGTVHLKSDSEDVDEWNSNFAQAHDGFHQDILKECHINPITFMDDNHIAQSTFSEFSDLEILWPDLNSSVYNRVENGLMMETAAGRAFERYRFGIECTDVPGSSTPQYRVRLVDQNLPKSLSGCDGRVLDFGGYQRAQRPNRDNSSSLPDRCYLRTHLAMARILYTSGVGEVIDQILEEEDDNSLEEDDEEAFSQSRRKRRRC